MLAVHGFVWLQQYNIWTYTNFRILEAVDRILPALQTTTNRSSP
jgi:hypothetical protein